MDVRAIRYNGLHVVHGVGVLVQRDQDHHGRRRLYHSSAQGEHQVTSRLCLTMRFHVSSNSKYDNNNNNNKR